MYVKKKKEKQKNATPVLRGEQCGGTNFIKTWLKVGNFFPNLCVIKYSRVSSLNFKKVVINLFKTIEIQNKNFK